MQKHLLLLIFSVLLLTTYVQAQKKIEEIKIQTSAQCEMCKSRIETAMAYEKGILKSDLNLEDKILSVTYKTGKITPEKIRKALNDLGYDADNTPAEPKAYAALPPCCKKPDDPDHIGH